MPLWNPSVSDFLNTDRPTTDNAKVIAPMNPPSGLAQ